jgi:cytochrome c553
MLRFAVAAALLAGATAAWAESIEQKAEVCGVCHGMYGLPEDQGFVKEDALAFAEYFAAKPWPSTSAPSASKADIAVATVAEKSVVCTSCHLEEFQGDSSVPRLAGQVHGYLFKTMTDFRAHTRANNPGMSDLMNTVTPDQIAAIANYLAGL